MENSHTMIPSYRWLYSSSQLASVSVNCLWILVILVQWENFFKNELLTIKKTEINSCQQEIWMAFKNRFPVVPLSDYILNSLRSCFWRMSNGFTPDSIWFLCFGMSRHSPSVYVASRMQIILSKYLRCLFHHTGQRTVVHKKEYSCGKLEND